MRRPPDASNASTSGITEGAVCTKLLRVLKMVSKPVCISLYDLPLRDTISH